MNQAPTFEWIGETGGPLLLLPDSLLPEWSGIDVPDYRVVKATFRWSDKESRACDYDRACDVSEFIGVIAVGHGSGLVIGGPWHPTTWVPHPWGGIVVRWVYAESEEDIARALKRIPALPWDNHGEITFVSTPLTLFNSAEPGLEEVLPRLEVALPSGDYTSRHARYDFDPTTALELIELRRAAT